jgi:hypothetical protein
MGRELPDRGTEAHRGQLLRPPRHSLHLTELPVMGHRGNRATEYLSVEKSVPTPLRTARRWRKHQLAVLLANRVIGMRRHRPSAAATGVCASKGATFLVVGNLRWASLGRRGKESKNPADSIRGPKTARFARSRKNRPVFPDSIAQTIF